jgi:hypothetical protein
VPFGSEKVPLPMTREMDLPLIKISKYERHLKNRYIDNFMYISFDTAVFGILYCMFGVLSDFQGPPLPMALSSPYLPQTALCIKKCVRYGPYT